MITECAVSDCKKAAFTGKRYCLPHAKALDMAVGRIHYDNRHRELVDNTPSLHVPDATEVAEQEAGWAYPPRYRLTQGWTIYELNGGLPSLGKDQ